MRYDSDFGLLARGYSLLTINIIYYLPDFNSLLNEFMWQTLDLKPRYPRVTRFLKYWEREIEGKIKEVQITESDELVPGRYRRIEGLFNLK